MFPSSLYAHVTNKYIINILLVTLFLPIIFSTIQPFHLSLIRHSAILEMSSPSPPTLKRVLIKSPMPWHILLRMVPCPSYWEGKTHALSLCITLQYLFPLILYHNICRFQRPFHRFPHRPRIGIGNLQKHWHHPRRSTRRHSREGSRRTDAYHTLLPRHEFTQCQSKESRTDWDWGMASPASGGGQYDTS